MPSHETEVVPSSRPLAIEEAQLIDRVEEMSRLKKAADRAVRGEGGVVFLYGEAGIGKTRLAKELAAYARLLGMRALYGRCPALFRIDVVPPYVLWSEVLKDYLETCTSEQLYRVVGFYPAEVAKLVPELKQRLGMIPQSFPISPESEQNRLFEAVTQFVTNISRDGPLLVVLDDLQLTDQSSLLLLHYLARGAYKEPLLLLGAYRDADIDERHVLSPLLTELNRERLLHSVQLKRMSFDQTSEMVKQILGQDALPREFCEMVYQKTKGNPFFVEEVIKSMKEDEVIYLEENEYKIKEISKIEFPKSVKSILKVRIARLDEECQNVLTMASFVGNDFTLERLRGVTGIEEDKLLEIVEKILKAGLFTHRLIRGEDVCSFADTIVRDVVQDEVGPFRRKKLHNIVGYALEKVYAKKPDEHLGELAFHFLKGGDKDKALGYFLKAGEKAEKVYAHNEAFSYFQHAGELLEEKEGNLEEKARIAERLGDIKKWIGEIDACTEYWNRSLTLRDQLGDKKSISRLHVKMANVLWDLTGDKEKASEHHHLALDILEKEPESIELASLYEDISHMLWRSGKSGEALSWTQKAFELAVRLGDSQVLGRCYNNLASLSYITGEIEKASKYLEQGLKIDLENNLVGHALVLYYNLCALYWNTGQYQKEFETALKGSELAKKVGDIEGISGIDFLLAGSYMCMGEMQKSISMSEDLLALAKRAKDTTQIPLVMWTLGECYRLLGEWDKSLQYLTESLDIARKVEEFHSTATAALSLGELYMEMEDYAEAEKYFKECNSVNENAGDTSYQFSEAFPALSRLYLNKGEIEKAKELIEKTYEHVTKTRIGSDVAYAEMLKAMLFREQKNWEQSIEHFEKSLQGYKSLNAQKWYAIRFADLLYEYGLMHLGRNESGDKEKAYSLLDQALEVYQRIDSKRNLEKVKSKMIHIEGRQAISEPKPIGYIATGYADLDKSLYGGLPPTYAVVLTSPSCDERDLLVKSFLETGAKNGEATFYITMKPGIMKALAEEFQSNFYLFVCNPQADAIIKSAPNVFKSKGVENLTDISIALTSTVRKLDISLKGPRRICISLVSDVLLQHHAVQTRRWLAGLIPELQSEGFTTMALMDPEMHPPQEVRAVLDLFDGEINIHEKETEKGLEKFLNIRKMSNWKYLEKELLLKKEELQEQE